VCWRDTIWRGRYTVKGGLSNINIFDITLVVTNIKTSMHLTIDSNRILFQTGSRWRVETTYNGRRHSHVATPGSASLVVSSCDIWSGSLVGLWSHLSPIGTWTSLCYLITLRVHRVFSDVIIVSGIRHRQRAQTRKRKTTCLPHTWPPLAAWCLCTVYVYLEQ